MQNGLEKLTLNQLMDMPAGKDLEHAVRLFFEVQNRLYANVSSRDSDTLLKLKAGTIVTLAVLKKLAEGKDPRSLTKEDWLDIARQAEEYSAFADVENYALFVFVLYAEYISYSASILKGIVPEEKLTAIKNLSEELYAKAELFRANQINETTYTDDCLWICLEAMIKLIASMLYYFSGLSDYADLAQAAAAFTFEYGRLKLLQNEQALLTEYLSQQKQLDEDLDRKFKVSGL